MGYLSLGGSSSCPVDIRPPLGLGVPPRFLSLDHFLEVILLGRQLLFSWPGVGEWMANLLERSSIVLVKSSLRAWELDIGWMRVTSLDLQEDTW